MIRELGDLFFRAFRAPSSLHATLRFISLPQKPSTLFLIQNAATPAQLLYVITNSLDEILLDNTCLASVRLLASSFLLSNIFHCIQRLESHASSLRLESSNLLAYTRVTRLSLSLFRTSSIARAELLQARATFISELIDTLHLFVGMHVGTLNIIRTALSSQDPAHLARAIVTACRQTSSFALAISASFDAHDLHRLVSEAVRSSLLTSDHRDFTDAAEQLSMFWSQGSVNNAVSSRDIRLTFQILHTEIENVSAVSRALNRAIDRDFAPTWDIQRRPIRYGVVSVATIATTRSAFVHSRFLGGSGLAEDALMRYSSMAQQFVQRSVIEPVSRFYVELFEKDSNVGNEESIAVARASLRDMLIDFTEKHLSDVEGAVELARNGSMKAVMKVIGDQARNPVRNSLVGSLGHAILLQVQKLKCDVDELMQKSKKLLRAQELNLSLVALVPSLLTAALVTYVGTTAAFYWRSRSTDIVISGSQTAKFLMGDIHLSLLAAEVGRRCEESDQDGWEGAASSRVMKVGRLYAKIFELEHVVHLGIVPLAPKVVQRLDEDIALLRDWRVSYADRRRHVERMLACYPLSK